MRNFRLSRKEKVFFVIVYLRNFIESIVIQKINASIVYNNWESIFAISASKVIIQRLLGSSKFYRGTEMILQAICVAAVKFSVESVLESLISIYEHHYRDNRPLDDVSAAEEFQIAVNGPSLAHYDGVVFSAMSQYWRKKKTASWNFIRQLFTGEPSSVVKRLRKECSKLPFMESHQ